MVLSLERWIGKVAIVTGANSGIGAAITKKLVEEGIIVVGLDINIDQLEAASKKLAGCKGKLYAVKGDVSKEEDIINAFKWAKAHVGPIAILVNNAGVFYPTTMIDGETKLWKAMLDINLLGLCIASREAIKMMREHKIDGQIINIASLAGHKVLAGTNIYSSAKYGVIAATEATRQELVEIQSKIKVGCISPGTVDTPLLRKHQDHFKFDVSNYEYTTPEDIADAVVYTLSTPPRVQIQELLIRPLGEEF